MCLYNDHWNTEKVINKCISKTWQTALYESDFYLIIFVCYVAIATVDIRSVYLQVLMKTSLDQVAVSNNPVQYIICKPSMNKSHTCTTSPQLYTKARICFDIKAYSLNNCIHDVE